MLDRFFLIVSFMGNGWIVLLLSLFFYWREKNILFAFLTSVLINTLAVRYLKKRYKAPRPASVLKDVRLLKEYHLESFPSGDTALASVAALCLSFLYPQLIPLFLFCVFLVAYGRVYFGVHFPYDTIGGMLVGLLSTSLSWVFIFILKRLYSI